MERRVTVIPASRTATKSAAERPKLRVAAYCRVSTEHEEQLGSFENQVDYYTKLIRERPDYEPAGIFADEGISGTGTKKRAGFLRLIAACEEGRVDLVITKSISRFARNTADCLHYARRLRDAGIPVVFEQERINTMEASGELLFTILSSLAQEESRNISENTAWGIRSRFRQGIPHINTGRFMGYDKGADGQLEINPAQAAVVARIFREFLEGYQESEIARRLRAEDIPGVTGQAKWCAMTIRRMLGNEKYKGDLVMQKYYTVSFLTKELAENTDKLDKYEVRDAHEAIVSREDWAAVQLELARRAAFRREHDLRETGSCTLDPFFGRVFCAACGERLGRKSQRGREPVWRCRGGCAAGAIPESRLRRAVVLAWNRVTADRAAALAVWERQAASDSALVRLRARQMTDLTAAGSLTCEIPELTRMVLESIVAADDGQMTVKFLDGTVKYVCV